jgi:alpha-1,6-mannosyltransferase
MTNSPAVTPDRSPSKWIPIAIGVLGIASLVLYRVGLRANGPQDISWFLKIVALQTPLYLGAVWLSLRSKESRSLLIVGLAFATIFRLSILFAPPYLSDDIYRYVWDGRVQAAGINPYRYIPADQSLLPLRDEKIFPKINRRDSAPTIYPPVAEAVYFLTTRISESVTWMKATMIAFEAIAVWATLQLLGSFGLARQRVLIYAWHPLAVWEFAGSGHLDAFAIAFIALALLARRKNVETAVGIMLACATLVKFFPAVLFATLYQRWRWKMPLAFALTIVMAYLPYLSVGPKRVLGYLPGYASERGMISGEQYFLLGVVRRLLNLQVPAVAYLIFCLLVLIAVAAGLVYQQTHNDVAYMRGGLIIASVFMVLLSPDFAWYFAWLIPFLCFIPSVPVLYLTLSSFLLYFSWLYWDDNSVFITKALIFIPFFLLVAADSWRRRSRHVSSSPEIEAAQP